MIFKIRNCLRQNRPLGCKDGLITQGSFQAILYFKWFVSDVEDNSLFKF